MITNPQGEGVGAGESVGGDGVKGNGGTTGAAGTPWQLGVIPLLAPIIIFGVKKVFPVVPGALLPVVAPVLGVALDFLAQFAGAESNVWLAAGAGLAGVGVREALDQTKKALAAKGATAT